MLNRDSSKYRTPYSPWGGFTNGYEGDLRAHLITNQRNSNQQSTPGDVSVAQGPVQHAQHAQPGQQAPTPRAPRPKPEPSTKPFKVGLPAAVHLSLQSTKPAMQVPAKVSPVPLPPHVIAALAKASEGPPHSKPEPNLAKSQPGQVPSQSGATAPPALDPLSQAVNPQPRLSSFPPQSVPAAPVAPRQSTEGDFASRPMGPESREFADVPGSESMQFVERMMQNLRRASMNGEPN
jgi:hypothetical protein